MPHQRVEVCRAQRIPFEQAQSDVRIGDFNEALHDADLDIGHGLYSLFGEAAEPQVAERLYEHFCASLRALGVPVETGAFGARMRLDLANQGPVTIVLDGRTNERRS